MPEQVLNHRTLFLPSWVNTGIYLRPRRTPEHPLLLNDCSDLTASSDHTPSSLSSTSSLPFDYKNAPNNCVWEVVINSHCVWEVVINSHCHDPETARPRKRGQVFGWES